MIVELINKINFLGQTYVCRITYQRTLFPEPAKGEDEGNQRLWRCRELEKKRTISADPQQRTILFPPIKRVSLSKPCCSAIVVSIASKIVIYGRIWRRDPSSEVASCVTTCEGV